MFLPCRLNNRLSIFQRLVTTYSFFFRRDNTASSGGRSRSNHPILRLSLSTCSFNPPGVKHSALNACNWLASHLVVMETKPDANELAYRAASSRATPLFSIHRACQAVHSKKLAIKALLAENTVKHDSSSTRITVPSLPKKIRDQRLVGVQWYRTDTIFDRWQRNDPAHVPGGRQMVNQ